MCGAINCTHIIAVIGPLLLPLCTIMICDDMNSILNVDASYSGATHDSFLCGRMGSSGTSGSTLKISAAHMKGPPCWVGRWRCLLGARQLLCEPETAPGECWAHGPSRSRARRCRRPTPRPQPPPAPPPPPPTLCSAQGRTVTDSYAI
ncbi:uncharacterized protein isoform X1 [Choristoneura fumiferana]|uniref:uncharacterized protein isoform X1 n=1 Tax=Choristoneura fumiferana TaxID=7141 RepID=UPI003D1563AB